jgi:thymidylate kinase
MITVALIGADGAGKTTVGRRLEDELPLPATYLYMGVNAAASNRLLPTTRLVRALKRRRGTVDDAGPPDALHTRLEASSRGRRDLRRGARSAARVLNQMADEWYRQLIAWREVRSGKVVVFDRHYFSDFLAYDMAGDDRLPLDRRVHGWMLRHAYPRPDLVVFLDAPPEVLLARKGEGTLEALERRRSDYLAVEPHAPRFAIVDATQPLDDVVAQVSTLVVDVVRDRR